MNEENNREQASFSEIKITLKKVIDILKKNNLTIHIAGGIVPYLLLNQDSNRFHDDIDTICNLEDIERLREVFRTQGLYKPEWDSKNYSKDGKDYGFEMEIDGIPFGIYPYEYREGILYQYAFDPYNKACKTKEFPLKQLSDYACTYDSVDGQIYDTMGLEYIIMSKNRTGRPKDEIDCKKIYEYGNLREDIIEQIEEIYKEKDTKDLQMRTTGNTNIFLKLFSKIKNKLLNRKKQIKSLLAKNPIRKAEEEHKPNKKQEFLSRINTENNIKNSTISVRKPISKEPKSR